MGPGSIPKLRTALKSKELSPSRPSRLPTCSPRASGCSARVLVDTGMTELHPAVADLDPRLSPLSKQDFDRQH